MSDTPPCSTFEVLDLTGYLCNRKLRIVSIYRAPKSNVTRFLEEFENFLNTQSEEILWTIICGDFNLWLDLPDRPSTRKFLEIINTFNVKNNVHSPTARSGHILDLVLTDERSKLVSNIEVENFGTLIHHVVTFDVNILRKTKIEKEITFRDKKNFDPVNFIDTSCSELLAAADLQCSCSPALRLKKECVNCLCKEYNNIF